MGEIRDVETAKIATDAAFTGHLVLSTLHTNNAAQAILRLNELGVDPFMVVPSINGVMSQRLAGRICESCKEAYMPLTRCFLGTSNLLRSVTSLSIAAADSDLVG